jgi:hypothetical protein
MRSTGLSDKESILLRQLLYELKKFPCEEMGEQNSVSIFRSSSMLFRLLGQWDRRTSVSEDWRCYSPLRIMAADASWRSSFIILMWEGDSNLSLLMASSLWMLDWLLWVRWSG